VRENQHIVHVCCGFVDPQQLRLHDGTNGTARCKEKISDINFVLESFIGDYGAILVDKTERGNDMVNGVSAFYSSLPKNGETVIAGGAG
jgi:hypothetical protein